MIINNIVYSEKFHIVALFKDYLISDDLSEFLKRSIPKFYEYYETFSRIYPNYTSLPEAKFIYKNIHKKQKMIDLQQAIEDSQEIKKNFLIIIIILKKIILMIIINMKLFLVLMFIIVLLKLEKICIIYYLELKKIIIFLNKK